MHTLKTFVRIVSVVLLLFVTILKFDWNDRSLHYSPTLTRTVTEVGNVERIDYLDEHGMLAFAEDLHYASVIRTRDDYGRVISDFYLDEKGTPAAQPNGYFGLKKEYDVLGRNRRIVYTDSKGNPMMTDMGYAMLEYVLDEEDRIIEQWYLDTEENPVDNRYGSFGMINIYDVSGRSVESTHVDSEKRPYKISLGFATIKREFYDNGLMKRAYYFDENGNPAQSVYGQYGYYYEYNEKGRRVVTTFISSDGSPIVASVGYATVKKTYDDMAGTIETEMYFDEKGEPISLIKGQYGVRFDGEDQIYLDENGQDKLSLYTSLYNNPLLVVFFALIVCTISMVLNKKGNVLLLIGYLFFIFYMTLMNRNADETLSGTVLLWSYKKFFIDTTLRQEILNNIWLFIPLGTILYRLIGLAGILTAVGLSVVIEITQYITGFGLAEFDDILSNSIGGFIGCGIADLVKPRKCSTKLKCMDQKRLGIKDTFRF